MKTIFKVKTMIHDQGYLWRSGDDVVYYLDDDRREFDGEDGELQDRLSDSLPVGKAAIIVEQLLVEDSDPLLDGALNFETELARKVT